MRILDNFDININEKLFSENCGQIINPKSESSLFDYNEQFKNKFYFENLTDDCFFDINGPKNNFIRFYKRITKTGVGTIILGGINLINNSKENNKLARITNDEEIISSYKQIAFYAHSVKSKVILKVNAGIGRFYNLDKKAITKFGSNYCFDPENKQKFVVRATDNKCNEIINEFLKIMMLTTISNFDGIMIDASFSNLIGELSSQEFNKRIFGYYSNTNDFIKKALRNVNKKDKKIYLKLSVLSFFVSKKNDINLCETTSIFNEEKFLEDLKEYISLGIDGFEFVFGRQENNFLSEFNNFQDELLFESFIRKIRIYLNENQIKTRSGDNVLIFYHDNFSNFEKLEELSKTNIINLIDITKNIYSDNNFLKQSKNANLIRNCLKCMHCDKISKENKDIECLINPKLCEFEQQIMQYENKKVAIIGSGISGLVCALTLAERGYKVTIFEKENHLNPIGKLTTIFNFDKNLTEYFKYIENSINKFVKNKAITLKLNETFLPNTENLNYFNSIIVATGFNSKFLAVSGAIQSHVINIYDALKNKNIFSDKENIIIYAKSILSLKLALFLSSKKKKVTIIIKDIKLFKLNKNANLFYYFYILYKNNVNIYYLSRITQINEDNIDILINKNLHSNKIKTMLDIFSNSKIKSEKQLINIDCNLLIYEPEINPNNNLYTKIVKSNYKGEVYLIGNALQNTDLAENIKSGYFVGKNL